MKARHLEILKEQGFPVPRFILVSENEEVDLSFSETRMNLGTGNPCSSKISKCLAFMISPTYFFSCLALNIIIYLTLNSKEMPHPICLVSFITTVFHSLLHSNYIFPVNFESCRSNSFFSLSCIHLFFL